MPRPCLYNEQITVPANKLSWPQLWYISLVLPLCLLSHSYFSLSFLSLLLMTTPLLLFHFQLSLSLYAELYNIPIFLKKSFWNKDEISIGICCQFLVYPLFNLFFFTHIYIYLAHEVMLWRLITPTWEDVALEVAVSSVVNTYLQDTIGQVVAHCHHD